ncbi:MAG: DUF302 domain-containing protein [bacterium]|nr:DUF302 domain-containing protein [bacterium]
MLLVAVARPERVHGLVGIAAAPDFTEDLLLPRATAAQHQALQEQGFGVLTEIDVKATLKKKLDADFRRYVILGACNPHLANQALNAELEIGLLLPCNVIVYEDGDGSVVSIADPNVMMQAAATEELEPLAAEARRRLERVAEALAGSGAG